MKDYVIFGITEDQLKLMGKHGTPKGVRLIFKDGVYSHAEITLSAIQAIKQRREFRRFNKRNKGYKFELISKKNWAN